MIPRPVKMTGGPHRKEEISGIILGYRLFSVRSKEKSACRYLKSPLDLPKVPSPCMKLANPQARRSAQGGATSASIGVGDPRRVLWVDADVGAPSYSGSVSIF